MHRIDVPSATEDHKFTEGSPTGGVPATTVAAAWLNDLQENICEVIEGAGLTLTKGDYMQLLTAIQTIATSISTGYLPKRSFSSNDYIRIPDVPGGLIIQFGRIVLPANVSTTPINLTFPIAYPNAALTISATIGVLTFNYDLQPTYRANRQEVSMGYAFNEGCQGQAFMDNNIADARVVQWISVGY